jgi:hypothetical protein
MALDRLDHSPGQNKVVVPDRPAGAGDARALRRQTAEIEDMGAAYQTAAV